MADRGSCFLCGAGHQLGAKRVDGKRAIRLSLCAIHVGIGRAVKDQLCIVAGQAVAQRVHVLALGGAKVAGRAVERFDAVAGQLQLFAQMTSQKTCGTDHGYAHGGFPVPTMGCIRLA